MNKPKHRMKTVVRIAEACMTKCDRETCAYRNQPCCCLALINDMLWYLRQALEKSERKK